jgi:hypothetical protein
MKTLLLCCCFLFAGLAQAAERYVVTPGGDYYLIPKGQSALKVARDHGLMGADAVTCSDKATFGFSPDKFPPNGGHIGFHKDVIGSWFIVPANGTIDSVFWNALEMCAEDSTLFLRIHNSNVYPGVGPGYNGYPLPSSSTCWGFYDNTNDLDNGVAAFPEEATGGWHTTVDTSSPHGPSFPPTGIEVWGFGGFPVVTHANTVNVVDLADLGRPNVTVGQKIMINFRINGQHGEPCMGGAANNLTTGFRTYAEPNPLATQNWKFYEHVVTFQSGYACKGWVARGDFQISIWYTMTVSSNIPPRFLSYDQLPTTFSQSSRTISSEIEDCNPANPGNAGVASGKIRYTINGVPQSDIPLVNVGFQTWEADLPGTPAGTTVRYKLIATDLDGMTDSTAATTYNVVELGNEWYAVDTNAVCAPHDLSDGGGTVIDPSAFFNPTNTGSGTAPKDDGTAGPFDMGGNFTVFGDTFRYAWVGVNGAMTLSKSAADTNDANANGFATSGWNFPYSPVRHGRADTVNLNGMPRMFIAPFFADHIVEQDSPAATFGHIRYGNDGDPNLFVAEWDSVGTFDTNGSTPDITTFRVVLNKADGTIQFQYKSCGQNGLDSAALVGLQYDTSSAAHPKPYVFINNQTYPYETKPRDNTCVKFKPTVGASVADGWNMVSVSGTPADANYTKTHLFPEATSAAFSYGAGYVTQTTLANGPGYWMKFNGGSRVGSIPSTWLANLAIPVQDKWNMIGSVSGYALTSAIVPGTGTVVVSPYYAYHGGYSTTTALTPGEAFWVKVSGAGTLNLTAAAMAPKAQPTAADMGLGDMNTVTVRDAAGQTQTLYFGDASRLTTDASYYEMPPAPPVGGFDVRFTSNQMVETYAADKGAEFPIAIRSAVYPVTVSWTLSGAENRSFEVAAGAKRTPMAGAGSKVISDASVKTVVIRMTAQDLPKEFGLSQNYPNPFNPSTYFRVDVAKPSHVEVTVFDILGRKIITLLDAEKSEGAYTMEWNGRDAQGLTVPTGMYFIRMTAGEFTTSRKVSLMK